MEAFSCIQPNAASLPFAPHLGRSCLPAAVACQARVHPPFRDHGIVLGFKRSVSDTGIQPRGLNCGIPFFRRCKVDVRKNARVKSELAASAGHHDAAAYPRTELQLVSRVRGISFYAVTAVVALPLFAAMVAVHPFVMLFDRHRRKAQHFIAKLWSNLTVALFCKIEIEGVQNLPPPDTPAVYVSNHQSFLDIYTLLTLGRSFKFISKTAIFLFPIIGWAMYLLGTIPLRRMDSRSQLDCLMRCINLVKNGASVFFFPEGTRSKDGALGPFKKGAFSIAVKTEVPVVPITLIGTGKLMPTGMEGFLNVGSVKVVIHEPLKGKDADTLCSEARRKISNSLLVHGYEVHGNN